MHPKLKTGNIAVYARFSSDSQREASIEDQVRRCRAHIAQGGGDPSRAVVFSDSAVSGSSTDRRGFETMMAAVDAGRVDAIVTEDLSRISRDFADSANIFKHLQYASVPLLGVADGIDTSAKGAKLSFTVKSLVADLYLDDLRDKTLRGLEGRALAGFATGNVPYGYHTIPELDPYGRSIGSRIAIHDGEAEVVRRIFRESCDGRSLSSIAIKLNREGIPSPRAGTRHKRLGWGMSTIRAILYNEKYAGVWRFKERQWVKAPGSNKRTPRPRDASEVMTQERPELRIIDPALWHETQARLTAIRNRYTKGETKRGAMRQRTNYLFSGILICDECGGPMTIIGGSSLRYYACSTSRTKGTCANRRTIKEPIARTRILDAIRERLTSKDGIAHVRHAVAEHLRDYSRNLDNDIKERRERIKRTEDKIRGLIEFISQGDRSEYVTSTLRDLETYVRAEKATVEQLLKQAQEPLRLPSIDEITSLAFDLDARLGQDPQAGRAQLIRWLRDGSLRVVLGPDGKQYAQGALIPMTILADAEKTEPPKGLGGPVYTLRSGGRI
jgi:site-specific DNA recombinase